MIRGDLDPDHAEEDQAHLSKNGKEYSLPEYNFLESSQAMKKNVEETWRKIIAWFFREMLKRLEIAFPQKQTTARLT